MRKKILLPFIFIFSLFFSQKKDFDQFYGLNYTFRHGMRTFNRYLEVSIVDFNKDSIRVDITKEDTIKSYKKISKEDFRLLIKNFKKLNPNKIYQETPMFVDCHDTRLSLNIELFYGYSYDIYCLSSRLKGQKRTVEFVKKIFEIIDEDYNCYYIPKQCKNLTKY
ncbi:hypothetical protein GCM10023210_04820 [Chryseobacterium ginsengisoli]|uniref:Uncharacterized protein n=1 Tax=Chryseobacterium ginsengisoli TaxID=363853 RepID=A0ABP9LXH2_9FLAO